MLLAQFIGIVHEIVPASELLSAARNRARGLAEKPPVALRLTLCELRAGFRRGLSEAAAAAARYQSEAIATGDPQRAMATFLARRRGTATARERLHA